MKDIIALGLFCCVSTSVFAGAVLPPLEGCPSGWLSDGACKTRPGEQKCRTGYDCVNSFCCKQLNIADSVKQCPQGKIKVVGSCGQNSNPSDPRMECPTGSTCYNGICCRSSVALQCPKGEVKIPGECEDLSRSPVGRAPYPTCPTPARCYKGICCQSAIEPRTADIVKQCPQGKIKVVGSCGQNSSPSDPRMECPTGSTCYNGICCRSSVALQCPTGEVKIPGECEDLSRSPVGRAPYPTCPTPARCYKGICCQSAIEPRTAGSIRKCLNGQTQVPGTCLPTTPVKRGKRPVLKCPKGSKCFEGICCRPDSLPTCRTGYTQVTGQCPKCPRGSQCLNGICCRPDNLATCRTGYTQVTGQCPKCPRGSQCLNGICCRPDTASACRTGYTKVTGKCPNCPRGSQCLNGICCRPDTEGRCRKGDIQVSGVCPQCPQESTCYNGVCCQSFRKPTAQCPKIRKSKENEQRRLCPVNKKSPDQCRTNADCLNLSQGRLCCSDQCGRKYCFSPSTTPTALPLTGKIKIPGKK